MNPEANRRLDTYNGNPRAPDGRYPPNYSGMLSSGMSNIDNYLMLSQMMYQPPYPYYGFPFSNGPFLNSLGGWRDPGLGPINLTPEANSFRSYYNPQNMRVVLRETREKPQAKVINLQSDDEEPKQKNVLVPPNNNANKQSQKQALVINIDDNSEQKNQKVQQSLVVPKLELVSNPIKPQIGLQKIQAQNKRKSKEAATETKTKLITKAKTKQSKVQLKQQKSSKERRKKPQQPQRTTRVQKQAYPQKAQKKKSQRIVQKPQKLQKLCQKWQKLQKQQKVQKNRKQNNQSQMKIKPEQTHTKQIAKYLQSHGQIRHGKQFQSDIPQLKIINSIRFNAWLEHKRKSILSREIGALTY